MSNYLCIYHGNCADGFGAAWSVKKYFDEKGQKIDFHAGVYQQSPPNVTDMIVIIVDFSYKQSVIEEMAKSAKSILIIDHHKSAAEDLSEFDEPPLRRDGWIPNSGVYALFDMNKSGAMLAWEYFHKNKAPKLIEHIQDRDLWMFKLDGTREIQANVFSYPYDFEEWDKLMLSPVENLINDGKVIERKHFKDIKEFIEVAEMRISIWGHIVPCLNANYFWSSDAGHIMTKGYKFAVCWWDTPDGRVFSLRSDEDGIDVSEIAKQYGGGGHKNAAGFKVRHSDLVSLNLLPFAR